MSEYEDEEKQESRCVVCDGPLGTGHGPWVMLNRYGFGTGNNRRMAEITHNGDDDSYEWDMTDFAAEGVMHASGLLMCFPGCMVTFLEAEMIEADFNMRESNGGG